MFPASIMSIPDPMQVLDATRRIVKPLPMRLPFHLLGSVIGTLASLGVIGAAQ